ncbi:phosphotransferase [Sedimentibacter sp. zth1]|uniref:phosphotransferase n=1 Tax=Sedimentibacter sp. zth1 TaxID=2816908 RepID=UPI001A91FDDC|nr:phosphotransferase [Sedimentibacter sp. zth1]QSX04997.1 phosphotransferase [Sedimentibacter sp. zth1]
MYSLDCLIGTGNTAEVYDIGDNKVVKLFNRGYFYDSVVKEYNNSKLINTLDICTPKSYELVDIDERYGIIYDKIVGIPLDKILLETLNIEKNTAILAKIHKELLKKKLPNAVSAKSVLHYNITNTCFISPDIKAKLLTILSKLPDDDGFCHGDFHYGNILVGDNKNYVIDFMDICKGNRLYDIARTVYLIEKTPVPDGVPDAKALLQIKRQASVEYLSHMRITESDIEEWMIVISAARLYELRDDQTNEINSILHFLNEYGL